MKMDFCTLPIAERTHLVVSIWLTFMDGTLRTMASPSGLKMNTISPNLLGILAMCMA